MNASISIVVPVYSGALYLEELTNKIREIRQSWSEKEYPFNIQELIFVDDSSVDGSADILAELSQVGWIDVLYMSKNYGQHAATVAGISYSSGDWVVTIDEDLQHDPNRVLDMLKMCVMTKSDVLYCRPTTKVHESFFRDMSSKITKKVTSWITKNPNIVMFNSFRLIRGSIARQAASVFTYDGYFDVILSWYTNRVSCLDTEMTDQRFIGEGKSGYNFRKLMSHGRKLIMTSDAMLLRGAAYLGLLVFLCCIILTVFFLITKMFFPENIAVEGWTSQIITTLFVGSGGVLILSLMSEYIVMLSKHVHGKPPFSVVDRKGDNILKEFFQN